ncbi:MAG: agmatinase family protein [Pyrinomonadaceae bacterium MAG19_C2-C3]|nr:agmatinase family protein [Pyrinomonadaceae bacterium MAG19_C2-C3]
MKDSANQLFNDPLWQRASAWLAGEYDAKANARLGVLGAPLRLGSITPGDCHLAPGAIRDALRRFSTYDIETNLDLRHLAVEDFGDVDLSEARPEAAFAPLSNAVREKLEKVDTLVLLGGDNSVTRPALHGMIPALSNSSDASSPDVSLSRCALLTLDAHLDLRDTSAGLTNGNPVRALLEDGLPGNNITQIGIQPFANSKAYADVAREAGINVFTGDDVCRRGLENVVTESLNRLAQQSDAIYVDLDLDVLDRAFAPATPGSRPGGLTPAEIRRAAHICGQHPRVRVMDLVEIDASKDINDATALAAAACLLSFAVGLMSRP